MSIFSFAAAITSFDFRGYGYGRPGMTGGLIFNADITEHREFSEELWQKCLVVALFLFILFFVFSVGL